MGLDRLKVWCSNDSSEEFESIEAEFVPTPPGSYHRPQTLEKDDMEVGSYKLGDMIGEGSYASVRYGVHKATGERVAIKIISRRLVQRLRLQEQLSTEIAILRRLNHPNVTALKSVMQSHSHVYIVMEDGGIDLYEKLAKDGPMTEYAACQLFCQLLSALTYCHSAGVVHRDLKPENVLLSHDCKVARLCDFGLGAILGREVLLLNKLVGTINYCAPEIVLRHSYDGHKADVWSLGIVLYTMLTARLPFDEPDNTNELRRKIIAGEFPLPSWLSPGAISLLQAMIQPDPDLRADLPWILRHPWVLQPPVEAYQSPTKSQNEEVRGDRGMLTPQRIIPDRRSLEGESAEDEPAVQSAQEHDSGKDTVISWRIDECENTEEGQYQRQLQTNDHQDDDDEYGGWLSPKAWRRYLHGGRKDTDDGSGGSPASFDEVDDDGDGKGQGRMSSRKYSLEVAALGHILCEI